MGSSISPPDQKVTEVYVNAFGIEFTDVEVLAYSCSIHSESGKN